MALKKRVLKKAIKNLTAKSSLGRRAKMTGLKASIKTRSHVKKHKKKYIAGGYIAGGSAIAGVGVAMHRKRKKRRRR